MPSVDAEEREDVESEVQKKGVEWHEPVHTSIKFYHGTPSLRTNVVIGSNYNGTSHNQCARSTTSKRTSSCCHDMVGTKT